MPDEVSTVKFGYGMINSTSGSLKDSASKAGFRLMAFKYLCSGNWPARTHKLQSHDCLHDCRRLCSARFISLCTWSVLTYCR